MTQTFSFDVVICGAGIAGIAAAYYLAVKQGVQRLLLVDERPPLSLTSDKSTEAYRNWWPGPDDAMIALINRSLDLMEELAAENGNQFLMNRRGYLYATANPAKIAEYLASGERAMQQGAGALRLHGGGTNHYQPSPAHGYANVPSGADLITDRALIRQHFPYLAEEIVAVLHARRCGWLSGQQFGAYLLSQARAQGVQLWQARLAAIDISAGRVQGLHLQPPAAQMPRTANAIPGEIRVSCQAFVNAAGPYIDQVGRMAGVELPIFSELHIKAAFDDRLGVLPRHAPFLIYDDPQLINWTDDERVALAESDETRWLLHEFPAGVHMRVEGHAAQSQTVLMLWDYHVTPVAPTFPLAEDPLYPELVIRGNARLAPGFARYLTRLPKVYIDGGYYTKTPENRPLIGKLGVPGAYLVGAYSGFGLMAAAAGGELLAAHISGAPLPAYAPAFGLERYADPAYQAMLADWGATGQL
jgi:glycine/D-amino acid oxidase-like deaminating enzyme